LCNCWVAEFKLNLRYLPVIKGLNTPFHRSHSRYWLPMRGFDHCPANFWRGRGRRRDYDYLVKRFGEAYCSIFTMPIEIILRPQYGTRYFPVPIVFLSAVLMFLLPLFSSAADGFVSLIPFHGAVPRPPGMFGISSLSSLYFFLVFLHGFRIWRRMIHAGAGTHREYEGPALPFFNLIPSGGSFWFTRIVIEPLFSLCLHREHDPRRVTRFFSPGL
jgi:hypothetical protein